jgi:tRNA(fMet)-specific endonuclease VapC
LSYKYLLDANIISAIVREPYGALAAKALSRGTGITCTSIIVAGEIRFGLEKSKSQKLRKIVELALSRLPILELVPPVEHRYSELRAALERKGQTIGGNDMWIAAHALTEGLTLVTANEAEFSRVDGLIYENWKK